jgi:hypothetical protein
MERTPHISRDERGGGVRRIVALERRYHCSACGHENRSWTRLRSCLACGQPLAHAVIRRAAIT